MTQEEFWSIIEKAGVESDESSEWQTEPIVRHLAGLPEAEILSFQDNLDAVLARSYRADLWGAAYLINWGCSEDGFDYFRGWLISQGRAVFERALIDPDWLGSYGPVIQKGREPASILECEDMLYVADDAYRTRVGREAPSRRAPRVLIGELWNFGDGDEMGRCYPALWRQLRGD